MKKTFITICTTLLLCICLTAQKYESVTVKAGTKIKDYFPVSERYLYPQFTTGQVSLNNGTKGPALLNYNLLLGEIEFIKGNDTLTIDRKADIQLVTIAQDTFIYRDNYYKMIHSGRVKVYSRDRIELIDILKQGAMGVPNRTAAGESYNSLTRFGQFNSLVVTNDLVLRRNVEFFIMTSNNELVTFRKKNVKNLYMNKKTEIDKYLKSNKVNFESQEDILRFADWLAKFSNKI